MNIKKISIFFLIIISILSVTVLAFEPPGTGSYTIEESLSTEFYIVLLYFVAIIIIIIGNNNLRKKHNKRAIVLIIVSVVCVIITYFIPIKYVKKVNYGCFTEDVCNSYYNMYGVKIFENEEKGVPN